MPISRFLSRLLPQPRTSVESQGRVQPERVLLTVADGVTPSDKPPVRIFLGTETAQHRAERVFVWSIEAVRDPSRVYEIYLMKDLAGFDQRGWTTGFTNYRFAIPHFTHGSGRAIYNDVDQIYLADPGELLDSDMNGCGFLAISDTESSVMLIDCQRMASLWNVESARRFSKKRLLKHTLAVPGVRGPLAPEWNARDEEYQAGRSKLLHFTTLHTQPWRPFPAKFIYQDHPHGDVWHSLERAANAAGAHVFTRSHPSERYSRRLPLYSQMREQDLLNAEGSHGATNGSPSKIWAEQKNQIASLITASQAHTLLVHGPAVDVSANDSSDHGRWSLFSKTAPWADLRVTFSDPVSLSLSEPPDQPFDGVLCLNGLDQTPEEDIPWVLDELFGRARLFVYASVSCYPKEICFPTGERVQCTLRNAAWWKAQFETVAQRYPDVHWELATEQGVQANDAHLWWEQGGRFIGTGNPTVWVLIEDRVGNNSQSLGLAEALGWPHELKQILFTAVARIPNRLLGASRLGVDHARSGSLTPPWPDLVIATGRRLAPVARWIRKQSGGRTRLVHLGRKGGQVIDDFDLVVTCAHFQLPSHSRRPETVAPLNPIREEHLAQAAKRWPNLFGEAPRPHIALLVGGQSSLCRLDVDTAQKLGQDVRAFANAVGGTVHAVTSRRTGTKATEALRQTLGATTHTHKWQPGQHENPYLGYLATADMIVVTGESESMLAEAAASSKHMYIYPLPQRRPGLSGWIRTWVVEHAQSRPTNNRGTVRPQQGLEFFCSWILDRGLILPPRNLSALHQTLIRLNMAQRFGEPLTTSGTRPVLRETEDIAKRVRALLGVQTQEPSECVAPATDSATATV